MSNYIKIFRPQGESRAVAQVYQNKYGSSFKHISDMVKELKIDFPEIKDSDIKVEKFGGQRLKGITFVEVFFDYKPIHIPIPKGYQIVKDIEPIL